MLHRNSIDDVVLALAAAPIDERTGNRVLYSVDWVADKPSMIGQVNEDWVRRELDWFNSGSDKLEDMEGPVPKLFQACAGRDGRVNSAYGYILFNPEVPRRAVVAGENLYQRVLDTFTKSGVATRQAVAIISDRDIHRLHHLNERNDFICTNALNFMIDADNRLHIIAQMRSMDAVFGYRADWSMWDNLMDHLIADLNRYMELPDWRRNHDFDTITRGDITFQVANLHVYPRHFELLAETAEDIAQRIERRVWAPNPGPSFAERMGMRDVVGPETVVKPTGYSHEEQAAARAQILADEKFDAQRDDHIWDGSQER